MTGTRVYLSWYAMLQRCNNPNNLSYKNYGGRGISVCDRWANSFENFFLDMGNPLPGYSIDRVDMNGDYDPNNCRWATSKEQNRNTRKNRNLKIDDRIQCMSAWVEELNLNADKFRYWLNRGVNPSEAASHAKR